ncbi:hypothetical protein [Catenulispora rubra]|uniref:hypothetical protein n=1 Tax=Catenulispora rubra TaxID=280293 RepID=UPI001892601C|nr:hypothetical protein [Catenulispora rubra]
MKLVMLRPVYLPGDVASLRSGPVTDAVAELGPLVATRALSDVELLARLERIPIRPAGIKIDRSAFSDGLPRKERLFAIHDGFFGVFRATDATTELLAHCVLVGYRTMLREAARCGTTLDDAQWGRLRHGVEATIAYLLGLPIGEPQPAVVPTGTVALDPHRRWRSGHHVFFPLIQAIVLGLGCFQAAVNDGQTEEADEALAFATVVMTASGDAMCFASDFQPQHYGGAVRPAMAPPYLPVGLSGVMSEDHDLLIRRFRELREVFPTLQDRLVPRREAFITAVEGTYDAHKQVCAKFDGEHVVSLRMSTDSSAKAVGVLEQLERSRLNTLRSL